MMSTVQALEPRRLFAVTIARQGDSILIDGGTGAVAIQVRYEYQLVGQSFVLRSVGYLQNLKVNGGTGQKVTDVDGLLAVNVQLGDASDSLEQQVSFVDADGNFVADPGRTFDPDSQMSFGIGIDAGGGDDTIRGGGFAETIVGGDGDDRISSGGQSDLLIGAAGDDTFIIEQSDPAFVSSGSYAYSPTGVLVVVSGDVGNDTIAPPLNDPGVRMNVDGGAGDDTIVGSDFADSISGVDGNDYVSAGGGDDTVFGGGGNDILTAGAGRNRLYGGDGKDRLNGSNGRDFLYGEGGDDRIYGGGGNDYLDGGGNVDRLWGGDGADSLMGGSAIDRLYGESGNDTLVGGKGNDYLFGGDGDDVNSSLDAGDLIDSVETVPSAVPMIFN